MVPAYLKTHWREIEAALAEGKTGDAVALLRTFCCSPGELLEKLRPDFARMFERPELAEHKEALYALYIAEGGYPLRRPGFKTKTLHSGTRRFRHLYDDQGRVIEACELTKSGKPQKPLLRLDPDHRRGMLLSGHLEDYYSEGKASASARFIDGPVQAKLRYEDWAAYYLAKLS